MSGYIEIDAERLFEMLSDQKMLLIDVRSDEEIARGVIPGASHIPLAMIPVVYESLDNSDMLVFYCHSGIRSAQASAFVASKGRQQVYNLRGGVLAWGRAGFPFKPKD